MEVEQVKKLVGSERKNPVILYTEASVESDKETR